MSRKAFCGRTEKAFNKEKKLKSFDGNLWNNKIIYLSLDMTSLQARILARWEIAKHKNDEAAKTSELKDSGNKSQLRRFAM